MSKLPGVTITHKSTNYLEVSLSSQDKPTSESEVPVVPEIKPEFTTIDYVDSISNAFKCRNDSSSVFKHIRIHRSDHILLIVLDTVLSDSINISMAVSWVHNIQIIFDQMLYLCPDYADKTVDILRRMKRCLTIRHDIKLLIDHCINTLILHHDNMVTYNKMVKEIEDKSDSRYNNIIAIKEIEDKSDSRYNNIIAIKEIEDESYNHYIDLL